MGKNLRKIKFTTGNNNAKTNKGWINLNEQIVNALDGDDSIIGKSSSLFGIYNLGKIVTGRGNDTIIGASQYSQGIHNFGLIETGEGMDIVSAIDGGFSGNGQINLGPDNDTLIGFGSIVSNGDSGIDTVLLGEGVYRIHDDHIHRDDVTMYVSGYEKIGGSRSGLFEFRNGDIAVNAEGLATFTEWSF